MISNNLEQIPDPMQKKVSQNINSLKFDTHVKLANFHSFFYVMYLKFCSFLKSSNVIGSL